jgi:hypothetical protein
MVLTSDVALFAIPPGGGAITDFTAHQASTYPFVTFGDADAGALGLFKASE